MSPAQDKIIKQRFTYVSAVKRPETYKLSTHTKVRF